MVPWENNIWQRGLQIRRWNAGSYQNAPHLCVDLLAFSTFSLAWRKCVTRVAGNPIWAGKESSSAGSEADMHSLLTNSCGCHNWWWFSPVGTQLHKTVSEFAVASVICTNAASPIRVITFFTGLLNPQEIENSPRLNFLFLLGIFSLWNVYPFLSGRKEIQKFEGTIKWFRKSSFLKSKYGALF